MKDVSNYRKVKQFILRSSSGTEIEASSEGWRMLEIISLCKNRP